MTHPVASSSNYTIKPVFSNTSLRSNEASRLASLFFSSLIQMPKCPNNIIKTAQIWTNFQYWGCLGDFQKIINIGTRSCPFANTVRFTTISSILLRAAHAFRQQTDNCKNYISRDRTDRDWEILSEYTMYTQWKLLTEYHTIHVRCPWVFGLPISPRLYISVDCDQLCQFANKTLNQDCPLELQFCIERGDRTVRFRDDVTFFISHFWKWR